MYYWSEKNISEKRRVNFISDVDSLVHEKLKDLLSLIDEIIETNKETYESVYKKIEESEEPIGTIYPVIGYVLLTQNHSKNSMIYFQKNIRMIVLLTKKIFLKKARLLQ